MTSEKTKGTKDQSSEIAPGHQLLPKDEEMFTHYQHRTARQFEIARELGIAEGHRQIATLTAYTSVYRWAAIKKAKDYKGLVVPGEGGIPITINTWAEFCTHAIRRSATVVNDALRDFQRIGRDGYEALTRIGVNRAAMARLSRLPKDEREPLIAEVMANLHDPDLVQAALEDKFKQHKIEKDNLEAERDEARGNLEVKAQQIADKDQTINEYDEREKRREKLPIDEVLQKARRLLLLKRERAVSAVWQLCAAAQQVRTADAEAQNGLLPQQDINEAVYRVYQELEQTVIELGLPPGHFKLQFLEEEGAQGVVVNLPVNTATQSADDVGGEASNITPFPNSPGAK